jgi:hypothetical protein
MGFERCVPGANSKDFAGWWRKVAKHVPKDKRKGFNTMAILGMWLLWKHRNACVFNGINPNMNVLLRSFEDERHMWCLCLAGAQKLSTLGYG